MFHVKHAHNDGPKIVTKDREHMKPAHWAITPRMHGERRDTHASDRKPSQKENAPRSLAKRSNNLGNSLAFTLLLRIVGPNTNLRS